MLTLPIPQSPISNLQSPNLQSPISQSPIPIFHAKMPGGKTIPLLKTLLTSTCERNCNYCPFRAGRNYRRVTFQPEEMAQGFMDMYRAGLAQGLFLSSGIIKGGAATQDNPVELNRAGRQELLRVPGIGPKSSHAILRARRQGTLTDLHDLQALGVPTKRLKPFVLLDGKRPSYQLPLW
ncbi:MAG: hypothetical protein HF973_07015 [Chloroflexi bacterium]|nr:hypothetical protein [Chloroflexota bacterium]